MFQKILLTIQKYTKTDMQYLTTGSFWLSANQIVSLIFAFCTSVIMANILPTEIFGNYRYILSAAAIVGSFSLTGLTLAIIKSVAQGVQGTVKLGFTTQLKWSIGTFFTSLLLGSYYFYHQNNELALGAIIMGTFLPLISSANMSNSFWEGKKNYKKLSINSIITTIVYSVSIFVIIQFTTYLPLIIFIYFFSQAACALFFYKQSLKHDTGTSVEIQETITFGKHMSFLNVISTIAGQLDKVLVFHYMGATQLAIYSLALVPVGQVRAVLKQVAQLAFPKYSAKTLTEIHSTIYQKMGIFTIPIAGAVFGYILVAPFVFKVFFPKYLDAVLYSQVLMLSLLFFQKKLIAYATLVHASKRKIYTMSFASSLFKIVLLLVLLPTYGIWGAIYTELIIQATGLITSIIMLEHL